MAQLMSTFNAAAGQAADPRLAAARAWLEAVCPGVSGEPRPASGDASFRRYFRVAVDGRSLVLMDSPPEREPLGPFLRVAGLMRQCGLRVPEVLASDPGRGFALLEDFGDRLYLDALSDGEGADRLYREALDAIVRLQAHGRGHRGALPPYGAGLLAAEVELFRTWCCERHLGLEPSGAEHALLDTARERLCAQALAQPRVCVHRDYHSRNLMVLPTGGPGVLDFQDAVGGPVSYDVVSLLKDCYVAWPAPRVREWVAYYHRGARGAGVPVADLPTFMRWFERMGVQRHLKAAGIFARLHHRDGKPGYLADIPRTLGYVTAACQRDDELAGLGRFIAERVLPALPEAAA